MTPERANVAGRGLDETRAFFAARAATWDERFPDDGPAFAQAVADLGVAPGACILDVGCGTGRALPAWRDAVGAGGVVVGVDVTPEMLTVASAHHRGIPSGFVLADGARLGVASGCADVVFAAGLVSHLADPVAALLELRRVTRPGGRLALFHPVGRRVLAARHHRIPDPDVLLDPRVLPAMLADAGWALDQVDDGADRYLAVATTR